MMMFRKCSGVLAALALLSTVPLAAQERTAGGTDSAAEKLTYPIEFDTVEVYLMSLVPPNGRQNVKNLALSSADQILRVDADVKLGGLPGFELFGIPVSLLLGFRTSLGPVGLWWGLAAALGLVAIILALRTWRLLHQPLARVVVEKERALA